ncbi:MAG: hypothetical protein WBK26_13030 [Burkholderiaceae bacterium]
MKKAPKPSKVSGAFSQQSELFDLPAFSPTLPQPGTDAMRALVDLMTRPTLMQRDWLREGMGWRLAAEVHRLKDEMGWPVKSDRNPAKTGKQAIYSLPMYAKQAAHRLLKVVPHG